MHTKTRLIAGALAVVSLPPSPVPSQRSSPSRAGARPGVPPERVAGAGGRGRHRSEGPARDHARARRLSGAAGRQAATGHRRGLRADRRTVPGRIRRARTGRDPHQPRAGAPRHRRRRRRLADDLREHLPHADGAAALRRWRIAAGRSRHRRDDERRRGTSWPFTFSRPELRAAVNRLRFSLWNASAAGALEPLENTFELLPTPPSATASSTSR